MRGVNKVILIGTLGANPDVKFTANQQAIANLSVATSEEWTDKATGQKQQKTEWHRVVIFGKLAEIAQQYLTKGSKVYLEGKLQTRQWQDQSGQKRYSTEVVLSGFESVMQMLGGGENSSPDSNIGLTKPKSKEAVVPLKTTESMGTNSGMSPSFNPAPDWDDFDVPF